MGRSLACNAAGVLDDVEGPEDDELDVGDGVRTRTKRGGVRGRQRRDGGDDGLESELVGGRKTNEDMFFLEIRNDAHDPTPKTLTTRRHSTHLPNPEHGSTGRSRAANNVLPARRHPVKAFPQLMTSRFARPSP